MLGSHSFIRYDMMQRAAGKKDKALSILSSYFHQAVYVLVALLLVVC